jgi:D-glycero-alpha-D-manno-heptose-7-phosphate kinase
MIGTTIDKHIYLSMRYRSKILSNHSVITYSKTDLVNSWDEIQNPLIRETLKYKNLNQSIDFNSFSDIPSRTGLGGSSSFCIGFLHLINSLNGISQPKQDLIKDAIHIERFVLKEAGGIQDQIWPAYGGFNTIEINVSGQFYIKPISITNEFKSELQNSMVLIYTNNQRDQDDIAKSHENKNKLSILDISKKAHGAFLKQDIKSIGELLYESWKEKRNISNLISTSKVDTIVETVMGLGAYGTKLLGSGGCGFVLVICDPIAKKKITDVFKNTILDFEFDNHGVTEIFSTRKHEQYNKI